MRYILVLVACLVAWYLVRADDEASETAEKASNRLKRGAGYTTLAAYSTTPSPYKPSGTKQSPTGYTKVAYSTTPYPQKSSTTKKRSWWPWNRNKRQAWYTTTPFSYKPSGTKQSPTGYTKVAYSTTPYPQKSSTTKKKSWWPWNRNKRQAWYTTTPFPYKPSGTKQSPTGYTKVAYSTTPYPQKSSTTKKKSWWPWNRNKRQAWYTTTPFPYKPSGTKQSPTGYTKVAYSTTPYPQKSSTTKKRSWWPWNRNKRQAYYTAAQQYVTTAYPNYQTMGYGGSNDQGTVYQLVNQGQILLQEVQGALTDAIAAANYVKQLEETLL